MKISTLSILLFMANTIIAQPNIDFPRISTGSTSDEPIELKRLSISVFVVENIATTTFEMQFYNNNNRVMEGELVFPLANGVSISRFALDVNGEMREGVVVDKEKATQAFEAVVRQNIDPGIAELTQGNNFKTRVYPIPAKGYKKAIIAFEQELSGDNENFIYQLPLNFKQKLEELSVAVEVVMNKPKVAKSNNSIVNFDFTEARNSYISEFKQNDIQLERHIAFTIPKPHKVSKVLTYKGVISADNYFYVNISPSNEKRIKVKPSKIALVWDESNSGTSRDLDKELAFLADYLNWMQNGAIRLITFSNTTHTDKEYRVKQGKCDDLLAFLKATQFDGATNINAVNFNDIKADEILLFTDGISNFGENITPQFHCPLVAVNSSNIADHNVMESYSSLSNGVYINTLSLSDAEILELFTFEQKRFIKAEYSEQNIKEFYPANAQAFTGSFSCAGKAEGAKNELKLHFGFGNTISETHTITVDNTQRMESRVGERIWAQKKLKTLLFNGDEKEIKAHGKKYGLVTSGTSLIVLDRVEDYVRYEINPPASLKNEYDRMLLQQVKSNTQTREDRMKYVCKQFEEDYNWWKNIGDFRNEPKPKPVDKVVKESPVGVEVLSIVEDDMEISESLQGQVAGVSISDSEASEEVVVARGISRSKRQRSRNDMPEPAYSVSMEIKKWESNAAYMADLKAVDAPDLYAKYLDLKPENHENPSFYFDVATYLFQKNERASGLRVISNLAELELENTELLRTLGRKLLENEFYNEAIFVFNKVLSLRSFEPHSYIDLGTAYAENGEYQKAINYLYMVISKDWDNDIISRFSGIETIVLHDINNIIHKHKSAVDVSEISSCLIKHMPVDIRVVIDWDANETDIDLWTTDPHGEKCNYQHKETRIGGKISNDITQGYGPEEFRLKYAIEGNYIIDVNFFGTNKQTVMGNVTVRAMVYTGFGTDNEHKEVLTLQLEPSKRGDYTIGELKFVK